MVKTEEQKRLARIFTNQKYYNKTKDTHSVVNSAYYLANKDIILDKIHNSKSYIDKRLKTEVKYLMKIKV